MQICLQKDENKNYDGGKEIGGPGSNVLGSDPAYKGPEKISTSND